MRILFLLMLVLLVGCSSPPKKQPTATLDQYLYPVEVKTYGYKGNIEHYDWQGVYDTSSNPNIFISTQTRDKKYSFGAQIDTSNFCRVQFMYADLTGDKPIRKELPNLAQKLLYSGSVLVGNKWFSCIGFTRIYNSSIAECKRLSKM